MSVQPRVHPLLRQQESSLKSSVSCSHCQDFSKSFLLYQPDSGISENNPQEIVCLCEDCKEHEESSGSGRQFLEKKDQNRSKVYFFYYVECYEHPSRYANTLDPVSVLAVCGSHSAEDQLIPLNYSTVEQLFFKSLKEIWQKLCSDRIKRLLSFSLSSLLESCRWLDQVKNGVFCQWHPGTRASFLDKQLRAFCSCCSSESSRSSSQTPLSLFEVVCNNIIEKLRADETSCNPRSLNKFLLSVLHIPKLVKLDSQQSLNLLILEAQDLEKGFLYPKARCVFCLHKAGFAQKTLIQLKCGHLICFKCLNDDYSGRCLLDNQPLVYEKFFESHEELEFQCHFGHFLDQSQVWKFPCFHYSCETHLKTSACFQCGFRVDLWPWPTKKSSKLEAIFTFFEIFCQKHQKNIKFFNTQPFQLMCEDCRLDENAFLIEGQETAYWTVFRRIFEDRVQVQSHKEGLGHNFVYMRDAFYCNSFLKSLNFFRLMSLDHKYKTCLVLDAIQELFSAAETRNVLFSSTLYPKLYWSAKALKFANNTKVVLRFSVKTDLLLSGFIIAACFLPYSSSGHHYFNQPVEIVQKTVETDKNGKEIHAFSKIYKSFKVSRVEQTEGLGENQGKMIGQGAGSEVLRVFEFENMLYLSAEKTIYEFSVVLKEGYYYYSKAFCRLNSQHIEWIPIKKATYGESTLNGMISSPVVGMSFRSVNELLETPKNCHK